MLGRSPDRHLVPDVRPLLHVPIGPGRLPAIRVQVETIALDCGMPGDEASDWVTAVNELMANAVRHGGGTGELRIWADQRLHCEVRDGGPGFISAPYVERRERPLPSSEGGMGLWIASQMSDSMEIESGPAGTIVRISTRLPGSA
ncbi:ATP-binding protein [Phytohabitans kaempferiae]|uniref:ATP-binding protein n=1 Tax=Phytohabitans kaempferiae TaxID=1620943 RepID=A0ABV6LYT2_9ACTN